MIDHNNELTYEEVLESGCWAGFTIYPDTKMDEHRLVRIVERVGTDHLIVNSAADWGKSDPLKVPKAVAALLEAGIDEADVQRLVWDNPVTFFGASGRLELGGDADETPDPTATFAGNPSSASSRCSGLIP